MDSLNKKHFEMHKKGSGGGGPPAVWENKP